MAPRDIPENLMEDFENFDFPPPPRPPTPAVFHTNSAPPELEAINPNGLEPVPNIHEYDDIQIVLERIFESPRRQAPLRIEDFFETDSSDIDSGSETMEELDIELVLEDHPNIPSRQSVETQAQNARNEIVTLSNNYTNNFREVLKVTKQLIEYEKEHQVSSSSEPNSESETVVKLRSIRRIMFDINDQLIEMTDLAHEGNNRHELKSKILQPLQLETESLRTENDKLLRANKELLTASGKMNAELAVLQFKNGINRSPETPRDQISAAVPAPKPCKNENLADMGTESLDRDEAFSVGTDYFRCVLCLTETPQLLFLPCAHFCLCNGCNLTAGEIKKCYLCGKSISQIICPFMA